MKDLRLLNSYEVFDYTPSMIKESREKNDGKIVMKGILQKADTLNQNGRIYPIDVLQREVRNYQKFIVENRALGELDHPDSQVVNLQNVSHNVVDLWWEGNDLLGRIEILSTPSGNIAKELLKSGIRLGISSRGMGSVRNIS